MDPDALTPELNERVSLFLRAFYRTAEEAPWFKMKPEPVQQQQQPEPVCPECGGQGIAGAWVECERCKGKAD